MKGLRQGGTIALGIVIGICFVLFFLLGTEKFWAAVLNESALAGAILGAVIAGLIGVGGQLLIIVQSELLQKTEEQKVEKATLQQLIQRINRSKRTFSQCRDQFESNTDMNNVVFSDFEPLTRPLTITDLPQGFSDEELVLPLNLEDTELANLMNVFDSNVRNFAWANSNYEPALSFFLNKVQAVNELAYSEGKIEGEARFDVQEYDQVSDLQDHVRVAVYQGLVLANEISILLRKHLLNRHKVRISFQSKVPLSDWEALYRAVDLGDLEDDIDERIDRLKKDYLDQQARD